MSESREYDVLIVGQGISGTALALQADRRNISYYFIDHAGISLSSRIAPGIFNPVVFKRLTGSWMANELIPFLLDHYKSAERILGIKIVHMLPIMKLLNEEEKTFWLKKSGNEMKDWLSSTVHEIPEFDKEKFKEANAFLGEVKGSGWIDLKKYLHGFREKLRLEDRISEIEFKYDKLQFVSTGIIYEGLKFRKIIFCEGFKAMKNPFFPELKFKPVKGDIFDIEFPSMNLKGIINKDLFLQSTDENIFRCGSTYIWDFKTASPEEEMKSIFQKKWMKVFNVPFKVHTHYAAIRPSSSDRRPMLGESETAKGAYVLNGMGTKGVMLAPYFANHLLSHIFDGEKLLAEVNIARFRDKNEKQK